VPAVIGVHADRYRVEVDAEYGIILSVHTFFAGRAYQTIDMVELELDGPLDAELFEFDEPPPSQTAA
jgi:outer membrane lipoprotein-sorting protein